jgi:cytochrome c-type biogenesis protein CcmH/NrfG
MHLRRRAITKRPSWLVGKRYDDFRKTHICELSSLYYSPDFRVEMTIAERLLRETRNRFPQDAFPATQLSYLLAKRQDPKAQDEAETLLRDQLRLDPSEVVASSQLAYLLAKRPDPKAQAEAETLLRDALFRSPGNIVASSQLAYVLAKRPDRTAQDEAEMLLRDVLRRSPGNIMTSGQLAYLLARRPDRKDQDEAETLLRDVLRRVPGDMVASGQLAHLLAKRPDRKDQDEAARLLTEPADITTASSQPTPSPAEQLDVQQEMDRVLEESIMSSLDEAVAQSRSTTPSIVPTAAMAKASAVPKAPTVATTAKTRSERADVNMTMAVVRRGGRLRRLAADLPRRIDDVRWRNAAAAEVGRIFAEDENFAYAQYLKNELGEDAATESRAVSGTFAIAFIGAIKRKDPERFKDLEFNHPSQSRLVDVARSVLFEDRAAANRVVQWLNAPADAEPRSVAALRGFFEQRFGVKISGNKYRFTITNLEEFLNLVAANDNVRLDLIESALVPADLALAA